MSGRVTGERNGRCRLTDGQCLALLAAVEAGATYRGLAAAHGVGRMAVWYAVNVRAVALRGRQVDRALQHFLARPPWT